MKTIAVITRAHSASHIFRPRAFFMAKKTWLPYNQFMAIKFSIIVLTYNSERYVDTLIKSIYEHNTNEDFEIIVVDNNSTDDTVKKVLSIKYKVSSIKLILNKENTGFAKGINIGAKEARGEYLLFINPDTEWKSGSIENFVSMFESDSNVGVIGGKILAKNGETEKSAGRFLKTTEVFLMTLGLDEALGVRFSPNKKQGVDFLSGGFMAVRKDLFEKLSGFDENLFMYVEDMEFCFRVQKTGMKILFEPFVQIIHESHGSSSRSFAIQNIYKGLLYFHKKHGTSMSYSAVKLMLTTKAGLLVLIGKIMNNKYLTDSYSKL